MLVYGVNVMVVVIDFGIDVGYFEFVNFVVDYFDVFGSVEGFYIYGIGIVGVIVVYVWFMGSVFEVCIIVICVFGSINGGVESLFYIILWLLNYVVEYGV